MDAFEFNKYAGAILFAMLVIFGTKTATDIIFKAPKPAKPGYEVEVAEAPAHGAKQPAAGEAAKAEVPLATLLAKASAEKGKGVAKKCAACHTFDKGGKAKIGPNLYGVLGRALGAADGFAYSGALKAKGGNWDYEALDSFIARPKAFIKGTKMAFPGIKKAGQRADLILYLRAQGDNPPPLPQAKAAMKPAAEKAAAMPMPEKPAAMADKKPAEAMQPKAEEPKAAAMPMAEKPMAMASKAEEPKAAAMPMAEKPMAMASSSRKSLGARLAGSDAERGKAVSGKCKVCHTFENGGPNKIGPNLYGIVGRDVGSKPDFSYSDAVKAKGGTWTFEQLDCFITKPKECVPGTRMPFPGLPDAAARADLLAFLRTLSDSPAELPAP